MKDLSHATTVQALTRPSKRQLDTLRFVHEYASLHGYAPTLREIGAHLGISSTNGVSDHVRALARKGFLVYARGTSRAIGITEAGLRVLRAKRSTPKGKVEKRLLRLVRACLAAHGVEDDE